MLKPEVAKGSYINDQTMLIGKVIFNDYRRTLLFAVLTIRRPENREKPRISREKGQLKPNFSLNRGFSYSRIVISQERNSYE